LYYPVEGKSASVQRGIFIDGELPYTQLNLVEFSRIWVNAVDDWEKDNRGNDLKPSQIEAPQWITSYCYDSDGYETGKLGVYFTKGIHTITLYSLREPMILRKLILNNSEKVDDYTTVLKENDSVGAKDTSGQMIRIEAEDANRKSSQMLYPSQDKSSPAVYPYSASELRNNTIGMAGTWRNVGQWLEWDFEVPESGYYYITLHARQNYVKGIYTSRKIMIDGEVPFTEMNDFGFKYNSTWHMVNLEDGNENQYKFYIEKGKHTLRMEVVLGDFSSLVSDVQDSVVKLNAIYRKVIRITGVEPDKYRDYQIQKSVQGLEGDIQVVRDELDDVIKRLKEVSGTSSDKEAVLVTMRDQLDYLQKDVERFTKVITSYKINVSALGTWISSALQQPLALDSIYIYSPDKDVSESNNSFMDRVIHTAKTLYYSFVIDYNTIGNVAKEGEDTKTITVWVGSGRDQANVIKSMIDETFTKNTNINVNVMLVDMSTLLQATLSGQGPDVALQVGNNLPMDYGLRNAVVDLGQFSDLEQVKTSFRDSAMVPFEFNGKTYALPETQTFLMMFYRKDILAELGLKVPETWDEMKVALSVLSKNQMDLGMLPVNENPLLEEQVFAMLLYQNGGQYYNEDATASALDNDKAIRAFKEYCEFYTDYKLDRVTAVDQRFRTGEAPIIIADYNLYNQLQVSAPDIKGLWGFTQVPGTVKEDGTVDHTVSSTGTASIMMEASKEKEAAWEFMKWWVSADTQTQYGREMEGLMGASARYPTANIEAFANLPWPTEDYEALAKQFDSVKGIPQVPGGYYTWRNVNNAFFRVVASADADKMQPREALTEYVRYINEEITYKRQEFGLPTAQD
ncbi:MAG TPA: extracellular solute-binding protein, partial [Lachnospiraceae bacterium]|nr:extracellular solute-binding protein [Lachnospiraceae bacterium]